MPLETGLQVQRNFFDLPGASVVEKESHETVLVLPLTSTSTSPELMLKLAEPTLLTKTVKPLLFAADRLFLLSPAVPDAFAPSDHGPA